PQPQEHSRKGGVAVLVFVEGRVVQVEAGVQDTVGALSLLRECETAPHVGVVLVTDEVQIVHAMRFVQHDIGDAAGGVAHVVVPERTCSAAERIGDATPYFQQEACSFQASHRKD